MRVSSYAMRKVRIFLFTLASCATGAWPAAGSAKAKFPQTAEDVLIVDCLLPGQVRKLGRINSFLSPRRPARLSQFECGLRGGEYVEYDRATLQSSLDAWSGAAAGGDVEAMVMVGEALAKGLGATPDHAQALFWFQRAADKGDRRAMQNLGHLHELGLGVPADREKALEWYRRASGVTGERVIFTSTLLTETRLREQLADETGRRVEAEAQIAGLRTQIEAAERDNRAKRAQVERLRREAAAAPKPEDVKGMWLVLEEQILAQERTIRERNQQIRGLEQALLGTADSAALASGPAGAEVKLGALTLAVLDPPLLAARGSLTAAVPQPPQLKLSGRIQPRDGLRTLWVGQAEIPVGTDGLFHTEVAVDAVRRIQLSTLETSGARAAFEFTAVATGAAGAGAATPAPIRATVTGAGQPWPTSLKTGKRWLLAIGNRDYRQYEDLGSPVDDAEAVAAVLERRYGFSPRILRDATRVDLLLALDEIRRQAKPEDDVIVYYAGHGELGSSEGGEGAWIPVDASPADPAGWVPNRVVADLLSTTTARNVLVIADSCYAATLTSASIPTASDAYTPAEWQAWAAASGAGRSRLVLSSGGVRPVLDAAGGAHSDFSGALLKVLERSHGAVESQRLYREVSELLVAKAMANPLVDLPVFAPLRFGGHQQGELLLFAGR